MQVIPGFCGRSRSALYMCIVLLMAAGGCDIAGPVAPSSAPQARVLGLVEVTIAGLGSGQASASALSARDVAGLELLRGAGTGDNMMHSLVGPANLDGTGDGTIRLEPLLTGSFTNGVRGAGGMRYIYATFRVRNAQTNGTAYDTPRHNLTFLAAATVLTLEETAFSSLERFDGSPVAAGVAPAIVPTGSVMQPGAAIAPALPDVLQVLTEAEVAAVLADAPTGVTTVFPYGFVVRNASSPGSRTLPENPASDQFDGLVTFAFRVPLQATVDADPYSVTAMFVAVDDAETRVTESIEEQGSASAQSAADALPASGVTLLGNSATVISGHGVRRICRVRTAGTDPSNPAATLVDAVACTTGAVVLPDHVVVVDIDAAPGGDGRSWATAFVHLQDALACTRDETGPGQACEGVTEIWVAEGTYYPDEGTGETDNLATSRFTVREGVSIYGGFVGAEYARGQRDWTTHVTTLDGDLDGDGTLTGNARMIVHFDPAPAITRATTVDGFTVRAAVTAASESAITCVASGGGVQCSPTLRNLVVTANGGSGGALISTQGGGVATPLFDNVTFTANHGTAGGGAVLFSSGGTTRPIFLRTRFDDNSATRGGAIFLRRTGGTVEVDVYNVSFRNNSASQGGGAVYGESNTTIRLFNSELWNNTTTSIAGAIRLESGASATLVNSTVARNSASIAVVIYLEGASLNVHNSIIYGNVPGAIGAPSHPAPGTATNSVMQGGCAGFLQSCISVIDVNPGFADLAAGDLRLVGPSQAADAGSNAMMPSDLFDLDEDGNTSEPWPFDLAGRPRLANWSGTGSTFVDLGAYEKQ